MPAPTITTLPDAPSISDPANFATEASAHVASLATLVSETNAFGSYLNSNGFGEASASYRNLLINGDMSVKQRVVATTGITTSGYYACDRWRFAVSGLGTWSMTQESTGPAGFGNSLRLTCTTADASPAAGDVAYVVQHLMGRDLQRLQKGLATAKSVTLSATVRSNKTGTYQVNILDNDNTRIIGATYTISSADTDTPLTLTFDGDTTGALDNDNAKSLSLEFWLGSGTTYTSGAVSTAWEAYSAGDVNAGSTVNLADTIGNYWQISGAQLEEGTTKSSFEHLPYPDNLRRCQEYGQMIANYDELSAYAVAGSAFRYTATQARCLIHTAVSLRSTPSLVAPTVTNGYVAFCGTQNPQFNSFSAIDSSSKNAVNLLATVTSSTVGEGGDFGPRATGAYIFLDAELT